MNIFNQLEKKEELPVNILIIIYHLDPAIDFLL